MFALISGFLRPDAGHIYLAGRNITGLPPHQIARLGIGRLFQDVRLFRRLSAIENVMVGLPGQAGEGLDALVSKPCTLSTAERRNFEAALAWLEMFELVDVARRPAEQLSYGQQKLVAMARLVATGANVLLLDEPTAGLSAPAGEKMLRLLRDLASRGKAVLVVEHNLSLVWDVSDFVYLLDDGRVVAAGPPDIVREARALRDAFVGADRL